MLTKLKSPIKRRCAGCKAHYVIGEEGRKQVGGDRLYLDIAPFSIRLL